ncbi:MFS transporter [Leptospira meyeri]|uniref:NNP family nitrate/nitrite transporter-like MFS transporter n=1 Tax=Leptospira meyeri TaxID=29508 RepID=A0A4R8MNQ9_LEPME|nr:MFS transporter [Leptospira meyeri]TDY67224.1 NNP family nitrate/nitrite transporter-like MFS transporter [Leptospira meyeri]
MTITPHAKATKIELFSLATPQMRTFHLTWIAFFLCFFGWFGIAPLMVYVREELSLTKAQVGNIIIASVAITIFMRLFIGWLCDKIGPRISYTILLTLGSIPVMCIGLADSYLSFLLLRLAIGAIGASFVITQYHTSVMFAPNIIGTANATTAGWGNLGGGVTQMVMPILFGFFVAFGFTTGVSWRLAMVVPGAALFFMGIIYYFGTQDTPGGNFKDIKETYPTFQGGKKNSLSNFLLVIKDPRVWLLFLAYGACFGIELTINNIAALYYVDQFQLSPTTAGLIAGLFGLMNLFARTLGGAFGDKFGIKWGLRGRVIWLSAVLAGEGLCLILFSQMSSLILAISSMIVFSLFVQMSEGATFSVVPFVNKKAIGAVSGIVGAGGNAGAVSAGFLFRGDLSYQNALLIIGVTVTVAAFFTLLVRFSTEEEKEVGDEMNKILPPVEKETSLASAT